MRHLSKLFRHVRLKAAICWVGLETVRLLSSPVVLGLGLALYGLGTHYVSSMREYAPLKVSGWFDVKSQVGNVFYSALKNTGELPGHLREGEFAAVVQNLTNLAGIRSAVYTQLINAEATNAAAWFVQVAPMGMLILLLVRASTWLSPRTPYRLTLAAELPADPLTLPVKARRDRRQRKYAKISAFSEWNHRTLKRGQIALDRVLNYGASTSLAAAVFGSVLLNTAAYYQDVTSVTGIFAHVGTGLATFLDVVSATGAAVLKELIWHFSFLVTDGREKTLGWVLQDRNIEYVSHYLARFPPQKISAALNTAVYQAVVAGVLWAIAHALQRSSARRAEARLQALPPHMKRYLARGRKRRSKTRGRRAKRPAKV